MDRVKLVKLFPQGFGSGVLFGGMPDSSALRHSPNDSRQSPENRRTDGVTWYPPQPIHRPADEGERLP